MTNSERTLCGLVVALVAIWMGVLSHADAGGYPAGTLAAFSTDRGVRWVLQDGELADTGSRGGFTSFTEGVAATPDGRIVEAYWAELFDPIDGFTVVHGGIDVLSPQGTPEIRWLFPYRRFDAIAIDQNGNVWVTDSYGPELLQIDLADGSIRRRIAVEFGELLQDIDGAGFFYLRASVGIGKGLVIRIRTSEGAHVRDISLLDGSPTRVRIDGDGHLLTWVNGLQRLYTLVPDGQVLSAIEVLASSSGLALTPSRSAWFGFTASHLDQQGLKEIALDGTALQELALPPSFIGADHIVFVPQAPRGSLCDEERCAAATPTATPTSTTTPTSTPSLKATTLPSPTATTIRDSTATPTTVGGAGSGCEAESPERAGWPLLSLLLMLGVILVQLRRERHRSRSLSSADRFFLRNFFAFCKRVCSAQILSP